MSVLHAAAGRLDAAADAMAQRLARERADSPGIEAVSARLRGLP